VSIVSSDAESAFEDVLATPVIDPRKIFPATAVEFRDSGIKPLHISTFEGARKARAEFLDGARLLGYGTIDRPLFPQQLLIADCLNATGENGLARWTTTGVCVPRRATKTTSIWLVALGRIMNRSRYRVLYIAQSGVKGRERFLTDVVDELEALYDLDDPNCPFKVNRSMSAPSITWKATGSTIVVKPPKPANVRGDACDLVILDEAQELSPLLSKQMIAAIKPTMDTRPGAQLVVAGTAGASRDGLLWDTLEAGRAGNAGIVEFAADPDTPIFDRDNPDDWEGTTGDPEVWLSAHPGIGNLTPLAAIEQNFIDFTPGDFAAEYLGVWPLGGANALISAVNWDLCRMPDTAPLPAAPASPQAAAAMSLALSIAVDHQGRCATILAAYRDPTTQLIYAGIIDHRQGTTWVAERAAGLSRRYKVPIIYDGRSATNGTVVEALNRMTPRPKLEPRTWAQVSTGAAGLLALINDAGLRHNDQPELNEAVKHARKRNVKDGSDALRWSFGRVSAEDVITPVEALNLAVHAVQTAPAKRPLGKVTLQPK
jgi:hypothetical protein